LFYSPVFAQTTELTLDNAVNLALENNLSLRKTEIDLRSSGYSERNLWMEIFFPTINANASIGYRNQLFSEPPPIFINPNYSIGFGLTLGLNAGIPHAIRSIQLAHQANILRYEDARKQLSIQVTKRFYSLLAEKNNLLLLEEVLNLAQRQFQRSETLFRNGFVGELSLTQSRIALENARYNLSTAGIIHENNKAEFLSMIGIPYDRNITLTGEINIIRIEADAQALIREYLNQRPDIVRNRQEIDRLTTAQRQIEMQSRAPSLRLGLDWESRNFFDPFTDTLSASANLSVPIDPWIPGTSRNQVISRAADSVEKAKLDLEMAENAARTQIRTLTATLRNSWESIRIARLSLEAAQRGYQLTEQGFQSGTIEALVLEDARNNMANARQRLLQAELSYLNMILDLSAALNVDWKNFKQTYGVQNE
jgi:outer membrane protein TolC